VGTGFDLLFSGARSYFADFSAPTRNHVRLASVTVNVFRFELDLEFFRPVFGYLLLPLNVFRESRLECLTFFAVQSTIGNHFRHYSFSPFYVLMFQIARSLLDPKKTRRLRGRLSRDSGSARSRFFSFSKVSRALSSVKQTNAVNKF
jgi:hypothetical protein